MSLRFLLSLLLIVGCTGSLASLRRVDPGDAVELKAGEGFLLVAVDTSQAIRSVRVSREGRYFDAGVMRRPERGQNFDLYVGESGAYQWHNIRTEFAWWGVNKDPEFAFDVQAGVINYPGDLIVRPFGWWGARVSTSNRGLAAIDWLVREHPALYARYRFAYSGIYPDPFPAFFAEHATARRDLVDPLSLHIASPPEAPSSERMPLGPARLWQASAIGHASISRDGRLLVVEMRADDGNWELLLVDLTNKRSQVIVRSPVRAFSVDWLDDRSLVTTIGRSGQPRLLSVIRLREPAPGEETWRTSMAQLPQPATFIRAFGGPSPWMYVGMRSLRGEAMVHRVPLDDDDALRAFRPQWRDRVNKALERDMSWVFDSEGVLQLAIVMREDGPEVVQRTDSGFTAIPAGEWLGDAEPVALTDDPGIVYALTSSDRKQRDLVRYRVADGAVLSTVFSRPGSDVSSVILDAEAGLAGVRFYEAGNLISHYFDDREDALASQLRASFPGRSVGIADRDEAGRNLLIWVDGPEQPLTLYHLDASSRQATLIGSSLPGLAGKLNGTTRTLAFHGADGLALEAFLSKPAGGGPWPLVVMPHGGPIGIADTLHFDPEVQFLTSLGYAVLRVNFRGSDNYGNAVRDAGLREHGNAIEEDVDAAVEAALRDASIDGQRMCVVGTSYGGYSGLVAAMRWPDKYRCVVTISGVSDRALFFTASDGGRTEAGREELERVIGDPRSDLDAMVASSPLYHTDRIKAAVMIVHGIEDRRVDLEHARRLARMLTISGNRPVGLVFEHEGHGLSQLANIRSAWGHIAGFLSEHLDSPGFKVAVPPAAVIPN